MTQYTHQKRVRKYFWRVVEVAALLLFVALVCTVFVATLRYTLPFVIGGLVAILLLPVVRRLETQGIRRMPAVLTVMIGVIAIVAIGSVFVLVAVTREAALWSKNLPEYFLILQNWVERQLGVGKTVFGQLPPDVAASLQSTFTSSITTAKDLMSGLTKILINSVKHMPEYLFVVVIAGITSFFMLLNRDRMYNNFLKLLPPGWAPKVRVVSNDMMRAFAGTIRVQVFLMVLSAVLGVLGMWLLHIHYAVILGLVFGLTGMIPILGSALLTVPWAFGALLIGDVPLAIKIIMLQLVISLIRHMVEPKILADSVGLDTLSTLFALYVGMKLVGVIGLFVGPIVLIGIKSLLRIRLFVDLMPTVEDAEGDVANSFAQRTGMAKAASEGNSSTEDGKPATMDGKPATMDEKSATKSEAQSDGIPLGKQEGTMGARDENVGTGQ
ncbi:sporulation integral membrane protein YtvI [Alicyclobacillus ferrooxydans]|uniref:sporulation integral membrane protein YtvI n=1 Tax=Alicyclobacillus ferrooxydans TaxID=471514 RepID=UPI000A422D89|nr:sporulation integral membrane protein YtvI [Alicyclobacillus ferrooxydans]